MDKGRESRWEKDAMTVEIGFAVVSAGVLAAVVFAAALVVTRLFGLSGQASAGVLTGGALAGGAAGLWRLVHVLYRFDVERRRGR
ncbi:hypothetical protein EV284_0196 [Streptomyces sp. BK022]|uniref:DUF6332 family protein n=1 Tax=Streptomyces sp. BK022 TaxID=2512123 RepID=UPI001028A841|nr:DUF6332 family protein [Streptomyces sp. BK022]RZU45561.1 hypothetical protein EV284_0196 [Streptomyces sp. BK022]